MLALEYSTTGSWYTWKRGRRVKISIRERLDRGLTNNPWKDMFPHYLLQHLSHTFYDHCPLLLDTTFHKKAIRRWHFRFEASWLMEASCEDEVNRLWTETNGTVLEKLNHVSNGLDKRFKNICQINRLSSAELQSKLTTHVELQPTDEVLEKIVDTKLQLNLEMDKTGLYWEQRAHVNWLKNGDNNTTFFHWFALTRCPMNCIVSLDMEDGSHTTT
ncbi:hypothetical protein F3Y22_tig00017808pilonHSYRG00181 [Hibiscus syriacus]|uniref:Reverse transcriptase n=1 Tax=Hibiscus syriacus TaxID=106335 RepID=A0A6A3BZV2_HIBSY|nr:uncharacterized protein LOC120208920 [Hibiscus syriacus]KAE8720958.1 hypothetical protein F3Y22_tig00017808pilonHSYRG00181 [Hibiscus syriacus]